MGYNGNGSGSAKQVNEGGGGSAADLTSVGFGFGVVSVNFPNGSTFSDLSTLSTNYTLVQGICVGGAPRYQIDLQPPGDNNPNDGVSLYVNFGTPPYGGCPTGGPQTEADIIGGTTPQWQVFGGGADSNIFYTYGQVKSMFGNFQLLDSQIAVDAGWAQTGGDPVHGTTGTQEVLIENWDVSGMIYFPFPGGNANCANETLPAGTYKNVTAGPDCVINSSDNILGNVQVQSGGGLEDIGAPIGGNLQANNASWIDVGHGGTVGGNIQVQGTTGSTPSFVGDGSTANDLCNTTVGGNVEVQNNGAAAPFDIGAAPDCGFPLTIGGNLQVQNNAGSVAIGPATNGAGNSVHGDLQVQNNTGGVSMSNNSAGGNCQAHNNTPAATGSGNTAGHNNQGCPV